MHSALSLFFFAALSRATDKDRHNLAGVTTDACSHGMIGNTTDVPSFYHTSDQVRSFMSKLSSSCDGATLTRTIMNETAGNSLDALRLRRGEGEKKNRVALMFGIHGRELISSELAVHLLKALCAPTKSSSFLSSLVEVSDAGSKVSTSLQERALATLSDTEYLILPNVDEFGRQRAETGEPCSSRPNENRVDLERNWPYQWEPFKDDLEGSSGPAPLSEPESIEMKKQLEAFSPTAFLEVHSGDRAVFLPGAYTTDDSETKASKHMAEAWQPMLDIANAVNTDTNCNCKVGSAGTVTRKEHPGTSFDYVAMEMKVPFSMVYEVWMGDTSDCLPHFSPMDRTQYDRVLEKWTKNILYFVQKTSDHASNRSSALAQIHPTRLAPVTF